MITSVDIEHAQQLSDIYNYYIANTSVTFEEKPTTAQDFENRIQEVTAKFPFLVYDLNGEVLGYAYATDWKSRCAYKYSVETSIYLKSGEEGKGIGKKLYRELLLILKEQKYHTAIGGIALPNLKSVALHENLGYTKVAHFSEVGYKFDKWVDVAYWQLKLDNFV